MSEIVKSTQSCSNGHLPYHSSFYCFARALDGWRGVWICMRSNDALYQWARTPLKILFGLSEWWVVVLGSRVLFHTERQPLQTTKRNYFLSWLARVNLEAESKTQRRLNVITWSCCLLIIQIRFRIFLRGKTLPFLRKNKPAKVRMRWWAWNRCKRNTNSAFPSERYNGKAELLSQKSRLVTSTSTTCSIPRDNWILKTSSPDDHAVCF